MSFCVDEHWIGIIFHLETRFSSFHLLPWYMWLNSLIHVQIYLIIIIFFLCRARSSTSHTSSRLTVSRLRWQPVLTSTCSLFCSLRLPLHPVLAWPRLCRAKIRSSWWASPSSVVPYRNTKTLEISEECRTEGVERDWLASSFWRKDYYIIDLYDLWVIDFQMDRQRK